MLLRWCSRCKRGTAAHGNAPGDHPQRPASPLSRGTAVHPGHAVRPLCSVIGPRRCADSPYGRHRDQPAVAGPDPRRRFGARGSGDRCGWVPGSRPHADFARGHTTGGNLRAANPCAYTNRLGGDRASFTPCIANGDRAWRNFDRDTDGHGYSLTNRDPSEHPGPHGDREARRDSHIASSHGHEAAGNADADSNADSHANGHIHTKRAIHRAWPNRDRSRRARLRGRCRVPEGGLP